MRILPPKPLPPLFPQPKPLPPSLPQRRSRRLDPAAFTQRVASRLALLQIALQRANPNAGAFRVRGLPPFGELESIAAVAPHTLEVWSAPRSVRSFIPGLTAMEMSPAMPQNTRLVERYDGPSSFLYLYDPDLDVPRHCTVVIGATILADEFPGDAYPIAATSDDRWFAVTVR